MKSIKPGRAPSMMGAIIGIGVCIFGIGWTITAAKMGAPFFFPLFGVVFVGIGIVNVIFNFKNATGKNRFSSFDITDDVEEEDPFNERFGRKENAPAAQNTGNFCPYCGERADYDYKYCKNCGRELP